MGGTSPPPEPTPTRFKDYFLGIRLHNIKIEAKILRLPTPLTRDISIIKHDGWTAQLFIKEQPFLLIHVALDIRGLSPAECLTKLNALLFEIMGILATKYKIYTDYREVNIKHWEWAYRFKFSPEAEEVLEQVKVLVAQFGDKFKVGWDKSAGIMELETNDDYWAVFFYLMPFMTILQYRQVMLILKQLLLAKPEELKQKVDELRGLLGLTEQVKKDIEEVKAVTYEFATNLKLHMGVMKGMFGMMESQTEVFNEMRLLLKKLNEKLDKL